MEIIHRDDPKSKPLLEMVDDDIDDSGHILDSISCVKYKDGDFYRVKVITQEGVIPDKHTYKKKKKRWINGDYIVVIMLDEIKRMRTEQKYMRDEIEILKKTILQK